jgi:hypothetical protein
MASLTDDCIVCNDQWDCPVDHHIAPNVEGEFQRSGGSHGSCWEGLCTAEVGGLPAKHPRCAPEAPEQLQELLAAVASNRPEAVMVAVQSFGDKLRVVPERQALQLLGCSGEIIAHIPASVAVIGHLAE